MDVVWRQLLVENGQGENEWGSPSARDHNEHPLLIEEYHSLVEFLNHLKQSYCSFV